MTDPPAEKEPMPTWHWRLLELWDGAPPRSRRERLTYLAVLTLVFAPIPPGFAFAGWVFGGGWFVLCGCLFGAVCVVVMAFGCVGNALETRLFLVITWVGLVGWIACAFLIRHAEVLRREQEGAGPAAVCLRSPSAKDRHRRDSIQLISTERANA